MLIKYKLFSCIFKRVIVSSGCFCDRVHASEKRDDTDVLLANRCGMILHKYYNLFQYLPG